MEIKTQKKLDYLADTKAAIKAALIEQGQEVSDADTFRSYADKVLAISGVPADVHYVTFMSEYGLTELYERPVADGDNCADPVDRGYIDAPTKDSTPQYDYTHIGWASTPGGGWDETILNAITEDKTVYAAFAAAVRYYTISYYVDGVLDRQESLAYGATPSYTPTKDGYSFGGWTPAIATVTGDATYTAVWVEKVTFAAGSWADIARIAEAGEAADYFALGDTRTFTCNGNTLTAEIVGLNMDTLTDGTGTAGISCIITGYYPTAQTYHSSVVAWSNSNLRTYCNNTIYNGIQSDLKEVIKQVVKFAQHGTGSVSANDYCWVPARTEVGGSAAYESECFKYSPFDQNKRTLDVLWHLRSNNATPYHHYVDTGGNIKFETTLGAKYIRFGFCI